MAAKGLKKLEPGESYTGFCVLRKKEIKTKKDGDPYLVLELGDFTGRLTAKYWKAPEELEQNLKAGDLLKIKGQVRLFRDSRELHIEKIRLARKDERENLDELVPKSGKDVNALQKQLTLHLNTIKHPLLKNLIQNLFPDENALLEFIKMPSGKLWHHNYLYGTLEHLVCLFELADSLYRIYPQINPDKLKSIILLHHLGNPTSFGVEGFIDYSDEGRLMGPAVLAFEKVKDAIKQIPDFPEELRMELLHAALSSAGEKEMGAAVVPMTLEALVLSLLEKVDITTNAAIRILENDRIHGSRWTKFNNLLDRFLYSGLQSGDKKTGSNTEEPV
ncbi:MAG: OB-fold nucleic acid binding domain-containing protein [Calditrichia bacterium]